MPSSARASPAQSGITTTKGGERHIPSSTRADGTVRKEIRVRPGYRPPEDVEVYKNRTAEARKARSDGGVPGADFVGSSKPKPSKAKKPIQEPSPQNKGQTGDAGVSDPAHEQIGVAPGPEALDPVKESEKEAKRLSKKLRQARDLQQKKDKGEGLLPEQFEKVIRINELVRQLEVMGFDSDGQRKS